jgi:decaprenylphospho-beta-D-ribofuranose 2-oxidase
VVDSLLRAAPRRSLCGWGRVAPSLAQVVSVRSPEEVAELVGALARLGRTLIPRGAGRSYGDAAQNCGGVVLDLTPLAGCGPFQPGGDGRWVARVGAGTTLKEVLRRSLAHGLFLPVTPGTKLITVGGAIAADIHGKNHVADGSFGSWVEDLKLCLPTGELVNASRSENRELFEATLGGMGLTGVVVEATLRFLPLPGPALVGEVVRTANLAETAAALCSPSHRYAVAWLDLLSPLPARKVGRGVVVRSDFAPSASGERFHVGPSERPRLAVPPGTPKLLNRPLVTAFNLLRWQLSPAAAEREIPFNAHFFPLDAVRHWNRLYGRKGFLQYQFVVPEEGFAGLERVVGLLRKRRVGLYFAVLKRFGQSAGGPLSFPRAGFTLALDLPFEEGVNAALREADRIVAEAGGRVYLAKDVRLDPEAFTAMYPEAERFRRLRAELDPAQLFQSDLARRLGLLEVAG